MQKNINSSSSGTDLSVGCSFAHRDSHSHCFKMQPEPESIYSRFFIILLFQDPRQLLAFIICYLHDQLLRGKEVI